MPSRTDAAGIALKIELSGDFFKYQPGDTLYRNIGNMLDALAGEMESAVRGDVAAHGMPWAASHVKGYTTSPRTGKHWSTWAAVGVVPDGLDKPDAIKLMAEFAGRHKAVNRKGLDRGTTRGIEPQWHPFRRTKSAVYRMRAIASADLAKGMG